MGVQQHRRTKSRIRTRRSENLKLVMPQINKCPQCHELKPPHLVCPACGYYNNREVIATKKAE